MKNMKHKQALDEQKDQMSIHYEKYLKSELKKLTVEFENDKRRSDRQLTLQKEEIARLKRSREYVDLKIALFKMRQAGMIQKFINEFDSDFLDKDSLRDLFKQDLQNLFIG